MRHEVLDLNNISDIEKLVEEKERMKDIAMQSNINWMCRIDLYRRIREINEWINQLQKSP